MALRVVASCYAGNMRCSILLSLLLLVGCGDDSSAADASVGVDADVVDASVSDAGSIGDAGGGDASMASVDVTLTYRGHTEPLERARFGYSRTAGVITGLYFEIERGGPPECPTESSPTPDQVLILNGFAGAEPGAQTYEDGVRAVFFDYEGIFREEVSPAQATVVQLELESLDQESGIARATLAATFDEGTAGGTFTAVHCDSFDVDE